MKWVFIFSCSFSLFPPSLVKAKILVYNFLPHLIFKIILHMEKKNEIAWKDKTILWTVEKTDIQ